MSKASKTIQIYNQSNKKDFVIALSEGESFVLKPKKSIEIEAEKATKLLAIYKDLINAEEIVPASGNAKKIKAELDQANQEIAKIKAELDQANQEIAKTKAELEKAINKNK